MHSFERKKEKLFLLVALLLHPFCRAEAGPSINQYTVEDLESEPGKIEIEQNSDFSVGQPARLFQPDGAGGFIYDQNTISRQRHNTEVQLGITDWLKLSVGFDLEQERIDDPASPAEANAFGDLSFDEFSLGAVVVFSKPKPEGIGFGFLVEYQNAIGGNVEDLSELYFGPIIEAHTGPWALTANLAFVTYHNGRPAPDNPGFVADRKVDFSYFLQGAYQVSKQFSAAIEAYGTIDRLGDSGTPDDAAQLFGDFDQHRIGPVVYWTFAGDVFAGKLGAQKHHDNKGGKDDDEDDQPSLTVGFGPLFGLNENTPEITYKLQVSAEF